MRRDLTRTLTFHCVVRSGKGRHSRIAIPGKHKLRDSADDWPEQLYPGSLNALILAGGYPEGFDALGRGVGMKKLDEGAFCPAFVIPADQITSNSRGDGQVWRAIVLVPSTGAECACWVFRRIRSTIRRQIELVANERLRDRLGISDGSNVLVVICEGRGGHLQTNVVG